MAFCLVASDVQKFRRALKDGKINPDRLAKMPSSEARNQYLSNFVGEENAQAVNALFESKMLLKNQKAGYISWAKRVAGITPKIRRDLLTTIERLDTVLAPAEESQFLNDLVSTRLGVDVTFEESKQIHDLSEARLESKDKWEAELKENPEWSKDPHATRKEWINNTNRLEYGIHQVAIENYVNDLKLATRKVSFKTDPLGAVIDAVGKVPSITKSLLSSIDNSFFGRQGIKNLYGNLTQKRIWTRSFLKSFSDISREIRAKKVEGLDSLDLVKADIYSRPNALNGKYKAGKYKLDVLSEEAFPSSFPGKIPAFGRLFKASEAAFNGGALRMRADLADMYIAKAEKQGINTLDPDQALGIGNLVGSLTGRGSLDSLETQGRKLNVLLFSARFFKGNFDTITAHQFDPKATPFTKAEARKNLVSIVAHVTALTMLAGFLDPDSVEPDPRSTNFGRIKIFGKWTDVTGGMRVIPIMAARLTPTFRNGEWGVWRKSSTGNWTNLTAGKFGADDAVDVFMDALLLNRLSPVAGVIRDFYRGQMFGGDPFSIKQAIINSTTPISLQTIGDVQDEKFENIFAVAISEFLGLGVSTYKFQDNWERKTSQEMESFKEQVSADDFKEANDSYNRAYNIWFDEVQKDSRYKNLSEEGKTKIKSDAKSALKEKILKEYDYKKTKNIKTEEEKEEKKTIKRLLP